MMIKFVIRSFFYLSAGIVLLSSCSQQDYTIGQDLVSSKLRQVVIDTCTINMSTAFFDSTITSGKSTGLVGFYNDLDFGPTVANSYIAFNSPSYSVTNPTTAIFDSLCLRVKHNKYFCGDTMIFQNINVYPIQSKMELNLDNYLYNTSYSSGLIDYEREPLGSKYYRPKTGSSGQIFIRLNDAYGQRFFTKICGASDTIYNSDQFLSYFYGLALVPGPYSKAIFGFSADTSTYLRFYYHQFSDALTQLTLDVPSYNTLQFSQIVQDRTKTKLANFNRKNTEIRSTQTDHQVYMQPINSFYPVIEFPYLSELLKLGDYGSIVKAELELYPVQGTYNFTKPLPSKLTVYLTDYLNSPLGALSEVTSTSIQYGNLTYDYVYNINTKYTFDITSFLTQEISKIGIYKEKLQISVPSDNMGKTLESLVLGDQQHPKNRVKLKITYAIYDAK